MFDLTIRGGTVVTETGTYRADLGIEGGRIAAINRSGEVGPFRREVDATDLLVLPGIIDIHFHVRAPDHPERGTFASETQAAAAGGITTLLEMPISNPSCARLAVFEARKALGLSEAYVNFGLYAAPGLLDRSEILRMADAGACGYKIFTHAAPPGRLEEFAGICVENEADIYRVLELVQETGRLLAVHAENERMLHLFEGRVHATGRHDAAAFMASRPPVVEAMSIAQLAAICQAVPTHVHIVHVTSAAALKMLQAAQQMGLPMTGETCPQYLFFSEAEMLEHGPFAAIKPPLRTPADQAALWQGLHDGSLLAITTDHAPFTLADKQRGLHDIWQAAMGIPGLEALVPTVMTEALSGRLTLPDAVRLLATQPAKLFQLYPQKGTLEVGSDADITLYDPHQLTTIDSSRWYTKAKSIDRLYHGRRVQGHVHTTIVNGQLVYHAGQIVGEAGTGGFVRPLTTTSTQVPLAATAA
jgi:allantoinase